MQLHLLNEVIHSKENKTQFISDKIFTNKSNNESQLNFKDFIKSLDKINKFLIEFKMKRFLRIFGVGSFIGSIVVVSSGFESIYNMNEPLLFKIIVTFLNYCIGSALGGILSSLFITFPLSLIKPNKALLSKKMNLYKQFSDLANNEEQVKMIHCFNHFETLNYLSSNDKLKISQLKLHFSEIIYKKDLPSFFQLLEENLYFLINVFKEVEKYEEKKSYLNKLSLKDSKEKHSEDNTLLKEEISSETITDYKQVV